jgi:glycosyltransferase involved in cell wall biosynthesis
MTMVSVIAVFHNRASLVRRTVESLLAQDHDDLEIILVDDGSADATLDALQTFLGGRVRVESHPNAGFVCSLKRAISTSRGAYVAIQGSGDACHPRRISQQASVLDAMPEVGVVGCGTENIDPSTGKVVSHKLRSFHGDASQLLLTGNLFHHGEIMMRRALYDTVGGYRDLFVYAQDRDLVCRLSTTTHFHVIEQVLYSRFSRLAGSVSASPEKLLLQRCLSDFAVYCHAQRLDGHPDPLELHGPLALLLKPPSPRLARELRAMGLGALRRGQIETAQTFLRFAHAHRPHLLSWLGLASTRALDWRAESAPRRRAGRVQVPG